MIEPSIEKFPRYRKFDVHMLVDFIELRCIVNPDKSMVTSDLKEIFTPEDEELDQSFSEEDEDSLDDMVAPQDVNELFLADLFRHMQSRQLHYGKSYPFEVTEGQIALKSSMSDVHIAYMYLLLCSHLKYVANKHQAQFTSEFEFVSARCLNSHVVPNHELHIFGKNSKVPSVRYVGNALRRLELLAEDLGGNLIAGAEDFPRTSSGDSGIDIVGWLNQWDHVKNQLVLVGQCKCSPRWMKEKDARTRLHEVMSLNDEVANFFLIPFHFRRATNEWHQIPPTRRKCLIDRERFIKSFPLADFKTCKSFALVKDYIESRLAA